MRTLWLFLALTLVGVSACSFGGNLCTSEIRTEVRPQDPTVKVGDALRVELVTSTCSGRRTVPTEVIWSTDDTAVVALDSVTGVVRGRSVGIATVVGIDVGPYSVGRVSVIVRVVDSDG